jgi:quercetin 2,3-dioxygenase
LLIHQDARIYAGLFDGDETADLSVANGRRMYVHVAQGAIQASGVVLSAGDALQITRDTELHLQGGKQAEVLVFDLPGETANLKG